MPLMKNCLRQLPVLLLMAPAVGLPACANRGMEAVPDPFPDAGLAVRTGDPSSAAGGAASGGSGFVPDAGGMGGTSTASVATILGGSGSGGAVGAGGAAGSGYTVGAGATPAGTNVGEGGAGGAAAWGGAGPAPLIVSIDFIGGRFPNWPSRVGGVVPATEMADSETAGLKPAPYWNAAPTNMGTLANLRASDGSLTSATVSWNSAPDPILPGEWANGFTDAPGDVRMLNGYLDPLSSRSPATVKVSGLPASMADGYDVYVYAYGDIPDTGTRNYQYAIGNTTITVSQTGPSKLFPGLIQASSSGSGNCIVFRKVSGASFTLTATPGATGSRAPVNGFQIVWPSGS